MSWLLLKEYLKGNILFILLISRHIVDYKTKRLSGKGSVMRKYFFILPIKWNHTNWARVWFFTSVYDRVPSKITTWSEQFVAFAAWERSSTRMQPIVLVKIGTSCEWFATNCTHVRSRPWNFFKSQFLVLHKQ